MIRVYSSNVKCPHTLTLHSYQSCVTTSRHYDGTVGIAGHVPRGDERQPGLWGLCGGAVGLGRGGGGEEAGDGTWYVVLRQTVHRTIRTELNHPICQGIACNVIKVIMYVCILGVYFEKGIRDITSTIPYF